MMKVYFAILVCACVAALGLPAAAQTAGGLQSMSCDRACLSGLLDDYIAALKAHDPSRLPLAQGVRFTENNVPLALGDGLWNTIDIGELFKIKDNKIDQIEALVMYTPYGSQDVWTDRPRWTPAH